MQIQIYPSKATFDDKEYDAILPKAGSSEAAGVDVSTPYKFTLKKGEKHLVDTGLIIKAPRGYCILAIPRSGLAFKNGIDIANSPGLIDRDYSGPKDIIKIGLVNVGDEDMTFEQGDRVAQLVFVPYATVDWDIQESPDFSGTTSRGGFGSTGIQRVKL